MALRVPRKHLQVIWIWYCVTHNNNKNKTRIIKWNLYFTTFLLTYVLWEFSHVNHQTEKKNQFQVSEKKNLAEKKIVAISKVRHVNNYKCGAMFVDFIYFGGQGQNNITRIYECTSTINATHSCAYGCLYFANCLDVWVSLGVFIERKSSGAHNQRKLFLWFQYTPVSYVYATITVAGHPFIRIIVYSKNYRAKYNTDEKILCVCFFFRFNFFQSAINGSGNWIFALHRTKTRNQIIPNNMKLVGGVAYMPRSHLNYMRY